MPIHSKEGRTNSREGWASPGVFYYSSNHHKEDRADGHLFITVLAYQAIQVLLRKLKIQGNNDSWLSLREIFSGQQRVTAAFTQKNGRTLPVRKTTLAEQKLKNLYDALVCQPRPWALRNY